MTTKINMGAKSLDLSGFSNGYIEVTSFSHKDEYGMFYWNYLCKLCGNIRTVRGTYINTHAPTKCFECAVRDTSNKANKSSKEVAISQIYNRYKKSANLRDLKFNLDKEEFTNLIFDNCYYCGKKPSNKFTVKDRGYRKNHDAILYNGIDRKDNNEGYEIINCVSCCKKCNLAKNTYNEKEFLDWVKSVYEHSFKQDNDYEG